MVEPIPALKDRELDADIVMADTYTSLYYHIVLSTKNRGGYIKPEIEQHVWEYIGGIARENKMTALQVGGVEDHIHALVKAPPTLGPSKIAQLLKGGSSLWLHTEFPELRGFAWQDGFGAFTVSKSAVPDVQGYIQNQREHHHKMSFQTEYLAFLKKHEVDYDERYLWG
jgi:REP element-mobilizing transposase RayT